jgi:hypothetical protein
MTVSLSVRRRRRGRVTGTVLAIDPGLSGTGVALVRGSGHGGIEVLGWRVLYNTGSDKTLPWEVRARMLANDLYVFCFDMIDSGKIRQYDPSRIVSEFPMKMESIAGIAAQKHATMRLSYLVGTFAMMLWEREKWDLETVTPQEWKGQLPKSIVESRIARALGQRQINELHLKSHAWDAVGIGMWALGKF